MDKRIDESYRWCRQLCANSGSSFCWTFVLLPRDQCKAMYALYSFARITDDLGDSHSSLLSKRKLLEEWLQFTKSLDKPANRDASDLVTETESLSQWHHLQPALQHAVQTYQVPVQLLIDIVQGVMMDLEHEQPQSWPELERYCYHVASAVGLACTHIWRADASMPKQAAIDCGIGFQLTNILRDVANDARMGRIYLPRTEFERFGVDPSRWLAGDPNGEWQMMIRAVSARAEEFYASGWKTIEYLPPPSRRLFSLMWRYYHRLHVEVTSNVGELWETPRMRIPRLARVRLAAQHFIAPWFHMLPSPIH